MHFIDGTKLATLIRKKLKTIVATLPARPGLAIILIGDDPGSHTYVNLKEKAAQEVGIHFEKYYYPDAVKQDVILHKISELNSRQDIDGILVQFPLPKDFDENKIVQAISQEKDVDGFHPKNISSLLIGQPVLVPGLALGIIGLIEHTKSNVEGKRAAIVANSQVFSQPMAYLLKQQGLQVTVTNPDAADCVTSTKQADVVIVAIGRARFLTAEMIKDNAIIIDVGYNRVEQKTVGDVDTDSIRVKASWITPVPGGVGPMTVAMLLNNVVHAYEIQKKP